MTSAQIAVYLATGSVLTVKDSSLAGDELVRVMESAKSAMLKTHVRVGGLPETFLVWAYN